MLLRYAIWYWARARGYRGRVPSLVGSGARRERDTHTRMYGQTDRHTDPCVYVWRLCVDIFLCMAVSVFCLSVWVSLSLFAVAAAAPRLCRQTDRHTDPCVHVWLYVSVSVSVSVAVAALAFALSLCRHVTHTLCRYRTHTLCYYRTLRAGTVDCCDSSPRTGRREEGGGRREEGGGRRA
eukprot:1068544-Rhodomonas_salina.1